MKQVLKRNSNTEGPFYSRDRT